MSNRNKRDGGETLVLGLAAILIVIVAAFGLYARHESDYQIDCHAAPNADQNGVHQYDAACPDDHLFFGDGLAQWVMSLFAIVATGASLYGIRLLRDTFKETKRTADEAHAANELNKAILFSSVRPYLSIEAATVIEFEDHEGRDHWGICIRVENISRNMAVGVSVKAQMTRGAIARRTNSHIIGFSEVFLSEKSHWGSVILKPLDSHSFHSWPGEELPSVGLLGDWEINVCARYKSDVNPDFYYVASSFSVRPRNQVEEFGASGGSTGFVTPGSLIAESQTAT